VDDDKPAKIEDPVDNTATWIRAQFFLLAPQSMLRLAVSLAVGLAVVAPVAHAQA
jgi:hypothetical protein